MIYKSVINQNLFQMFQRSSPLPATPSCEVVCPQGPPGFNGTDVSGSPKIKICKKE